jgi:hypothetical protein
LIFEPEAAGLSVITAMGAFVSFGVTLGRLVNDAVSADVSTDELAMNVNVLPIGVTVEVLQLTVSVTGVPFVIVSGVSNVKVLLPALTVFNTFPLVVSALPALFLSTHPDKSLVVPLPLVETITGSEATWYVPDCSAVKVIVPNVMFVVPDV